MTKVYKLDASKIGKRRIAHAVGVAIVAVALGLGISIGKFEPFGHYSTLVLWILVGYLVIQLALYPITRKYSEAAKIEVGDDHLEIINHETSFRLYSSDFDVKRVRRSFGDVKGINLVVNSVKNVVTNDFKSKGGFGLGRPMKFHIRCYHDMNSLYKEIMKVKQHETPKTSNSLDA